MNQENICYRSDACRQANDGQNTLGNDNSVTGFTDQSDNLQQSAFPVTPTGNQTIGNQTTGNQIRGNGTRPTPTPTPTPTLGACPAGTVFDVTLQALVIGGDITLPIGTVLCLQSAGINQGVVAILPTGATVNIPFPITVQSMPAGGCPLASSPAALTSGVRPSPLIGESVCVALTSQA